MTEGRDVWWHDADRRPVDRVRARAVEAEHMLFALHTSGTTAKPKAVVHTSGGYLPTFDHPPLDLRHPRRRRLLVRRRHRLGHRPQLHRVRAADQRHHRRPVRGRPDVPRPRPPLADHRALRRHPVLHRADADPGLHQGRRRAPRSGTTCPRSSCSGRSASRSTPRPGSGTGSTSAAAAARSWTRGGRPRPAAS